MVLKEPKLWYEATFEDFGCKIPVIKKWSAMGTIEDIVFGVPMLAATGLVGTFLYQWHLQTEDLALPVLGATYLGLGWYRFYDASRDARKFHQNLGSPKV